MPINAIKSSLKTIPKTSGVYKFFDAKNQLLYVGKAKNLQKRVTSYSKENQLSPRIARMIFLAEKIEIIQTESEVDALFLEYDLIKKLAPKFNILLRDDKTFPQILITNHKFPKITKYRGIKNDEGLYPFQLKKPISDFAFLEKICSENLAVSLDTARILRRDFSSKILRHRSTSSAEMGIYFGPFVSANDVNLTIDILRKKFLLRGCSDSEFKSRKKPCLEFQIKKCSAPCVGMISQSDYKISVKNAEKFLKGKSTGVQKELSKKMRKFIDEMDYEKAAMIHDQIKSLNSIQGD